MSKIFKNIVLKGYDGEPIKLSLRENAGDPIEIKEVKLDFMLRAILNNAPLKTQNDSIQGMRLAQALDAVKDGANIEIEDGVHDWLKPVAEQSTPTLFRLNGNIIYKHICEGFEKPNQPEEKNEANPS